jgi:hypothetical protein
LPKKMPGRSSGGNTSAVNLAVTMSKAGTKCGCCLGPLL